MFVGFKVTERGRRPKQPSVESRNDCPSAKSRQKDNKSRAWNSTTDVGNLTCLSLKIALQGYLGGQDPQGLPR
jgi:hypothetical protein